MKVKAVILLIALLAVAGALLLPNWRKNRSSRNTHPCKNNLRMIQAAKEHWAEMNGITDPETTVTIEQIRTILKGTELKCNWHNTNDYVIGVIVDEPRCTLHGSLSNFRKPVTENLYDWWNGNQ